MKAFSVIAKIIGALVLIAGAVYVVATYGDKIVAWAKSILPCKCCKGDAEETTEEAAEEAAEEVAEAVEETVEAVEEAVEAVEEAVEAATEEAPTAEETDFAE